MDTPNAPELAQSLAAHHLLAHELIERLTMIVDSVNPDNATWTDVANLRWICDGLSQLASEES